MKLKLKLALSLLILTSITLFSQSKLKGNKIVTTQNREVSNFQLIEVAAAIDVYLFQGNYNTVSVETDENLQNSVKVQVDNNTLRISLRDKISKSKKMKISITVTDSLHTITAYENSNIYADSRLILRKLTINAFDNADFTMKVDADDFKINGYKNTDLNFDIFSKNTEVLISESCELKLEGEIETLKAELKNNSVLTAKGKGNIVEITAINNGAFKGDHFKALNATIEANSRTDIYVNASDNLKLSASNNAEISIYNNPILEITKLEGKAKIHKKK